MKKQQEKFCQEYVKDFNATDAYKRAGYKGKGNIAEASASRMLSNVKIQAKIAELTSQTEKEYKVDRTQVLRAVEEMAYDGELESNRKGALDMLMKHLGQYERDNKLDVNVTQKYEDMDDYYTQIEERNKSE